MEDTKNWQITLNPGIEMNENWYKIIFPLPQSYTLPDTYGKLYVNLKNQIVVVTITNNKGMTQFYGIGSIFGFALKEIIDNCSPLYRFPVTFFYNRSDKIMKVSKYSLCKVGIMAFNSKKIGKFKFVGR